MTTAGDAAGEEPVDMGAAGASAGAPRGREAASRVPGVRPVAGAGPGGQGTVGVVGLGLIGGSMAKAYKAAGWRVLGFDVSRETMAAARVETVDGVLDASTAACCDLVLLCVYPGAAIRWLRDNRDALGRGALVVDCCGVKRGVCEACMPLAQGAGFDFVGGHPMAGTQYSGFGHASATLFRGAPMVLVPPRYDGAAFLERVQLMLAAPGFGSFRVTTAEEHDRRIAYTSQLAHVVSNAYVKSPTAQGHQGFSAGSYRDLTRVAWLNEDMWTELFLDDADNLLFEVDHIVGELVRYRDALRDRDADALRGLLRQGRLAKESAEREGGAR